MATRRLNIDVQVSGGGALGTLAAIKGAIDSIQGKTVTITVNTRHITNATKAVDGLATALDRLPGAMGGGLDRDVDRARRSLGRLGESMGDVDRDARRASGSVGGLGRTSQDTDRSVGGLGDTVGGVGRGLGGLARGAGGASRFLGGLGASALDAGAGMARLSSSTGTALDGLGMFGAAAAVSAAGAGILTGAVGALGVAGVASLGGIGAAAGLAGGAMTAFTLSAHKDSARFGATLEQMGKAAHLGAQMISEPMAEAIVGLGRAMVTAENQLTPAGMAIATSLRAGFSEAAGVVNRSSGSIVDAAGAAAAGFARLTGEAAPGVEAFLGQLPSLTRGAVSGMSQITSEFGASAGAIEAATPALNRMMGSLGGLGAELVRTGRGALAPFAEDVGSMARGLTAMTSNLAPAIRPAMTAVTDTVNAASGGIGSLAPDIEAFSKTLSANAPQLESIVGSLGRGMLSFGAAAVDGLGMAAPAIASMADSIQANQPAITSMIAGMVGGAADVIGFGAEAIGVGAKIDNAVKSVLPAGGFGKALSGDRSGGPGGGPGQAVADAARGPGGVSALSATPKGGLKPGASHVGDSKLGEWVNKTFGLKSAGPQPTGGFSGPSVADISRSGGLLSMAESGAFAPEGSTGALRAAFGGASPRTPMPAGTNAPIAAGGGAELMSQMSAIPQGVAQARSSLNTLPTAAQSAMTGTTAAVAAQAPRMAGAMGGGVKNMVKTVNDGASAAEAGGESMGAAVTGGVGKGVTVTKTSTLTIIKKWIKQVIDTGMGSLDAHSPSRKFKRIGTYIPMGVSEGVEERGRDAMKATSDMFKQQQAEGDNYRAHMQAAKVITMPAPRGAAMKKGDGPDGGDQDKARPGPQGALDAAIARANRGQAMIPDWPSTREGANRTFGGPYPNKPGPLDPGPGMAGIMEGQWWGAIHKIDQDRMGKGADKERFFAGSGSATPNPNAKDGWDFSDTPMAPRPTGTKEGEWARSVFDRKTYGWEAKPGVDLNSAKSMTELNSMIQSPLDKDKYNAMMAVQGHYGAPNTARVSTMFGERTQQNIERGRVGAMAVANEILKHDARQGGTEKTKLPDSPVDISGTPIGGSGGGGESYLGKDRIAAVREAAALGKDTAAGLGKGIKDNQAAAVGPMGQVTRAQKKRYTDDWEISSPSAVAAAMSADVVAGLGVGLTSNAGVAADAMSQVSGVVAGVANDGALKVGYTWGTSFVDGVSRMVQRNLLQVAAPPSIESPAAKAALAAMGLWGPAGGGASVWKTPMVSIGGGQQSLTNNLDLRVYLGDELVMSRAAVQTEQQIGEAFEDFASTYVLQ